MLCSFALHTRRAISLPFAGCSAQFHRRLPLHQPPAQHLETDSVARNPVQTASLDQICEPGRGADRLSIDDKSASPLKQPLLRSIGATSFLWAGCSNNPVRFERDCGLSPRTTASGLTGYSSCKAAKETAILRATSQPTSSQGRRGPAAGRACASLRFTIRDLWSRGGKKQSAPVGLRSALASV